MRSKPGYSAACCAAPLSTDRPAAMPEFRQGLLALAELDSSLWMLTHENLRDAARVRASLAAMADDLADGLAGQRAGLAGVTERGSDLQSS